MIGQAWQQTQQELAQFINDHPAHPIAVIAFADSILFESPPSIDHASLRRSLTELQPSLFPINPEIGLNRANEIRNLEYSEIHIWSDFQRSGWEDVNWPEIPAHQLHFHAVGQSRSGNVAILQAQSYPRDAETLEVLVFVRNDNAEAVELPIQLSWENRTETITASLEPWETGPVVMHIPLPATPYGLLSLPEDAFALDNRHYVYLGPPPPTRVLALRPSSGDPLVMEEIFFSGNRSGDLYWYRTGEIHGGRPGYRIAEPRISGALRCSGSQQSYPHWGCGGCHLAGCICAWRRHHLPEFGRATISSAAGIEKYRTERTAS
ncbi:MAG: VWA domain-containing protein [Verrucomicrobia bacterium]|nr:VWA domain-containing protein [Verrucomicrobiota bacterium]